MHNLDNFLDTSERKFVIQAEFLLIKSSKLI